MQRILAQIATLGPIGGLPAPGTMGSMVALMSGLLIVLELGIGVLVITIIAATIIGFPAADAHYKTTGIKDSGAVVIDELVGQWLVFLAIPFAPDYTLEYALSVAAAFMLFRFFDIVKLGPVKIAEELPGAAGVMADDVVAGVFAGGVIIGVTTLMGIG